MKNLLMNDTSNGIENSARKYASTDLKNLNVLFQGGQTFFWKQKTSLKWAPSLFEN